ncbi:hypothetical protein TNCV_1118911 [Trichonephila clavipes]|uniref:Uncharacterized protein n=1 Tax=Trichonephila clavipes TaxID=2585209 RepID=A0A8X6SV65_TRICX|nr:hypothetical protein TNCV_1118911 [Trichonephila clavipes]
MDFTEINSRGKRGELLELIDRQNSRFRTAKTTVIKCGLHASFNELESAKTALNETEIPLEISMSKQKRVLEKSGYRLQKMTTNRVFNRTVECHPFDESSQGSVMIREERRRNIGTLMTLGVLEKNAMNSVATKTDPNFISCSMDYCSEVPECFPVFQFGRALIQCRKIPHHSKNETD